MGRTAVFKIKINSFQTPRKPKAKKVEEIEEVEEKEEKTKTPAKKSKITEDTGIFLFIKIS